MLLEILQKVIARKTSLSRRMAEDAIKIGRVTVNGKLAELGVRVDSLKDHIKLDGKLLTKPEQKIYLAFNKPAGVITSMSDTEGRPTIIDFLKRFKKHRLFPIGRLDYDSEGLLLITNDGNFANLIMHPSKKIPKKYLVKIKGFINEIAMKKLTNGIRLEDGLTLPSKVSLSRHLKNNSWIEITLYEGKNRQIKRMLDKVGYPVIRLKRLSIGNLTLGNLKSGEFRHIKPEEILLC